jgi:hypothetical protein
LTLSSAVQSSHSYRRFYNHTIEYPGIRPLLVLCENKHVPPSTTIPHQLPSRCVIVRNRNCVLSVVGCIKQPRVRRPVCNIVSSIIQLGCNARYVRMDDHGFLLDHNGSFDGSFLVWRSSRSRPSELEVGEQNAHKRECSAERSEDNGDDFVFHYCCSVDEVG